MIEALWSVEFVSSMHDSGRGIVVFESGKVLGGDADFTYVGSYQIQGERFSARIRVRNYSGQGSSVFGNINDFVLTGEGMVSHGQFVVNGGVEGMPGAQMAIRLTRRAELP